MAQTSIGPYVIIKRLGQGGMGVVFEAVHTKIKRRVAIKLLRREFARNAETVARFFHEALAVNVIDHPGLVQIYDHGQQEDGSTYLVMEYLHGETLADRLKHHQRPMNEAAAVSMAMQLASALAAAHSHGIVHRDLKPANIMLVADPAMPDGERVKLLDFGIAKLADGVADTNRPRTQAGMILGTPMYMAPEQCRGLSDVDGKADVYSLGVVLYRLLSGRLPFVSAPGEDEFDIIAKHLSDPPPPLGNLNPKLSKPLVLLVHSMLEKARGKRPSMVDVLAELKRIQGERLSIASGGDTLVHPATPEVPLPPTVAPVAQSTKGDAEVTVGIPGEDDEAHTTKRGKGLARRQRYIADRLASPLPPKPYVRKPARMMWLPRVAGAVPTNPGSAPSTVVPEPSTLTLQTRRRLVIFGGLVIVTLLVGAPPFLFPRGLLDKWLPAASHPSPAPDLAPKPVRADLTSDEPSKQVPVQDTVPPLQVGLTKLAVSPSTVRRSLDALPPLRLIEESGKSMHPVSDPHTEVRKNQADCDGAREKAYTLKTAGKDAEAYEAFEAAEQYCDDPWLIAERGRSMQLQGNFAKAVDLYEEYLGRAPDTDVDKKAKIQARLEETRTAGCKQLRESSQRLVGTDNYEKIEQSVDLTFSFCREAKVYLDYGRELRQAGRFQFAIRMLRKCQGNDTCAADREQLRQLMDEAQQALNLIQKPKPSTDQLGLRNPFQLPTPSVTGSGQAPPAMPANN